MFFAVKVTLPAATDADAKTTTPSWGVRRRRGRAVLGAADGLDDPLEQPAATASTA